MVPVNGTSEFLLAHAREALRRRALETGRTELSRAFGAWLLRHTVSDMDDQFAALIHEAATREGAQQDFATVAILGFGAEACLLRAAEIEVVKRGLRRQAGRATVVDGLPAAFCSDAVGILGIAFATKAVADGELAKHVVNWLCSFMKSSYQNERVEDWERCLFAAADQLLGGPLGLALPESPAIADVRTLVASKVLINSDDASREEQRAREILLLAMRSLPDDLACDRAALLFTAVEGVIQAAGPVSTGTLRAMAPKAWRALSTRDERVHAAIGPERFKTLTNAEIMREAAAKKCLRDEEIKPGSDAARRCLDRIRSANGYRLSREIAQKRATPNQRTGKNGQQHPA
jgi:hypothetical protein